MNNPCYALLAQEAFLQSDQPGAFLRWLIDPEGQRIISTFGQAEFGASVVRPKSALE
ncbi:hypothetical protein [Vampirovibrio sp.]|uniref:hypothetical protein n=1 Tax=Vampirovibrio sp. TaxID=2717857 RepID=UPI0035945BA2